VLAVLEGIEENGITLEEYMDNYEKQNSKAVQK